MGVYVPYTPWLKGSMEASITTSTFNTKLVDHLLAHTSGTQVVELGDFTDVMQDRFHTQILEIEKHYVGSVPLLEDVEISTPETLLAKMLSPAKMKKDAVLKAGLSVVSNHDDNPKD